MKGSTLIMRIKSLFYLSGISLLVFAAVLFASPSTANTGNSGHVAFYVFDSDDTSYDVEGFHDFVYFYGNLESWLKKNSLSYSFHETKEIVITTALGRKVSFTGENFEGRNDIGTIIIRPDGNYKMIRGVYTDVDLADEITSYLGQNIKK
jgi:hypothetical protein